MTPEQYRRLLDFLDARPTLRRLAVGGNRWLPVIPFVAYPILLIWLGVRCVLAFRAGSDLLAAMQELARAVLVPAAVFWLGTSLRARLNRPRPYEQPGFVPLVPREGSGCAFPSRHALSAAVLAAVWLRICPAVGVGMTVVALLICLLRVVAGVHYVRDVAAGALLGFGLGIFGMWFL